MMDVLLSDKFRFYKLVFVAVVVAVLVWWGAERAMSREVTFNEALGNVGAYEGREFTFSGEVVDKGDGRVIVEERGMEVFLSTEQAPELEEVPSGRVVSGRGTFVSPGEIEVADFHYHRYREVKVWLSLIISVLMFVWFWTKFRFDLRTRMFLQRRSC